MVLIITNGMKIFGMLFGLMIILGSCVSAKKYKQVEEEILQKEKQTIKLNNRLTEVKSLNRQLSDSAQRMRQ